MLCRKLSEEEEEKSVRAVVRFVAVSRLFQKFYHHLLEALLQFSMPGASIAQAEFAPTILSKLSGFGEMCAFMAVGQLRKFYAQVS